MKRTQIVVLFTMVLIATVMPLPADAASKYQPCSLLTAAELETALRGKVGRFADRDMTIPEGPFKGEIMSTCDWEVGSSYVTLNVIRGPRNPQEQAAGLASLRAKEEGLKKKGWTVDPGNIPGAECASAKPPASEPTALPGASCVMVSKGLTFLLGVNSKESVTVQQVKALADKVAARLP
jgi:hypothetical protein